MDDAVERAKLKDANVSATASLNHTGTLGISVLVQNPRHQTSVVYDAKGAFVSINKG